MLLNGTWPLRTHADRFFGTAQADGQYPKVAGLVCHQGEILALSLVGYDTSVSAVLATLWSGTAVSFLPNAEIEWKGPLSLRRKATDHYKQFSGKLINTREMHSIGLSERANIGEGILHPPDLPEQPTTPSGRKSTITPASSADQQDRTRFVLGNWDEEYPHLRSFLGTLYGLRVLFLHKDAAHPEWQEVWAHALWERGSVRRLIMPIKEALGFKAWKVSSDLHAWGSLVGDGTREGWLPWKSSTSPQYAASLAKDASSLKARVALTPEHPASRPDGNNTKTNCTHSSGGGFCPTNEKLVRVIHNHYLRDRSKVWQHDESQSKKSAY